MEKSGRFKQIGISFYPVAYKWLRPSLILNNHDLSSALLIFYTKWKYFWGLRGPNICFSVTIFCIILLGFRLRISAKVNGKIRQIQANLHVIWPWVTDRETGRTGQNQCALLLEKSVHNNCKTIAFMFNPKRIMRGPCGPRKTSTDGPAAMIGTQEPILHLMKQPWLVISFAYVFIPDENIFGGSARTLHML